MKRKLILLLLITTILFTSVFIGCKKIEEIHYNYDVSFDDLVKDAPDEVKNSITQVDKTKIRLSDELTQDREVLESVSYLYNLANQNLMNMDYYACVAYGHSIVVFSGNDSGYADSREYIVKDKDEWFYQNFAKTDTKTFATFADSAEERYSNDGGKTIYKRHGGTKAVNEESFNNFLTDTPAILYDKMAKEGEKHAPKIYTEETYNEFKHVRVSYDEIDNALIYAGPYSKIKNSIKYFPLEKDPQDDWYSTLTQASCKYDATNKLYTIEFDVDISNDSEALENGRRNLSASGLDTEYKSQHQTITIWESGLFCYYHTVNYWSAGIYGSKNDYNKFFTYNKAAVTKMVIPQDTSWTTLCKSNAAD